VIIFSYLIAQNCLGQISSNALRYSVSFSPQYTAVCCNMPQALARVYSMQDNARRRSASGVNEHFVGMFRNSRPRRRRRKARVQSRRRWPSFSRRNDKHFFIETVAADRMRTVYFAWTTIDL